jgi:hypothetical protein
MATLIERLGTGWNRANPSTRVVVVWRRGGLAGRRSVVRRGGGGRDYARPGATGGTWRFGSVDGHEIEHLRTRKHNAVPRSADRGLIVESGLGTHGLYGVVKQLHLPGRGRRHSDGERDGDGSDVVDAPDAVSRDGRQHFGRRSGTGHRAVLEPCNG